MIDTTLEYSVNVSATCLLLFIFLIFACWWIKGIRCCISEKTWKTISNTWVFVCACNVMVFFLSVIVDVVFLVIKIWQ